MFKVGQRVWLIKEKQFAKIVGEKRLTDFGEKYAVYNDDIDLKYYSDDSIHETADDMFEELGFSKSTNSAYAKYHKHNIKITFVNDVNGKMVSGVPAIVTPQLHQAIHQKLIELGWIE